MGCGAFGTAGCGVWGGRGGGEFHLNGEEGAGEGDSSTWVGGGWEEIDLREGGGSYAQVRVEVWVGAQYTLLAG